MTHFLSNNIRVSGLSSPLMTTQVAYDS